VRRILVIVLGMVGQSRLNDRAEDVNCNM
jgi:hypothetical protein